MFKVRTDTLISELKKETIQSYNLNFWDYINYGLYLPPDQGKKGKFLQGERTVSEYPQLMIKLVTQSNDKSETTNFPNSTDLNPYYLNTQTNSLNNSNHNKDDINPALIEVKLHIYLNYIN